MKKKKQLSDKNVDTNSLNASKGKQFATFSKKGNFFNFYEVGQTISVVL